MKLNGWQRLWVVTAVLYGLLVAIITWTEWPPPTTVRKYQIEYEIEQGGSPVRSEILWGGSGPPSTLVSEALIAREEGPSTTSRTQKDDWFAQFAPAGPYLSRDRNGAVPYTAVEFEHETIYFPAETFDFVVERELRRYGGGLWTERRSLLLTALGFWAGPLVALYGLGAAAGWVVRGFRRA